MITQEEIPYTREEIKAMVKTIDQLRKEKNELIAQLKEEKKNLIDRIKDYIDTHEYLVHYKDIDYIFNEIKKALKIN